MTDYREILTEEADGVLTVTLNRPDRLNAWTGTMQAEVEEAITRAGQSDQVRCIVVTGAGRGFCAGVDMQGLTAIQPGSPAAAAATSGSQANGAAKGASTGNDKSLSALYPGRFGYLYDCPKPVIAAINGACAGIGLVFTLYADFRFAAETAKFTTAFAQRGLIAEHGIAWLLPRLVGEANALDLLLTARKFTGAEAGQLGLVNRALPEGELMAHVGDLARHFVTQVSPRSVAVMKRQIRQSYAQSFAASLAEADREMEASFGSFDFKEGVASFMERRPPAFQGA